jgi:hypothetical protein
VSHPAPDTPWIKASRSATSGQCVELRRHHGLVEVRDSKDPAGPVLRFVPGQLAAWLGGARHSEFDHLTG